ncbi:MAG: tRNA pseudouridine(38-40) synthase TruA [Opitutales bacterium]
MRWKCICAYDGTDFEGWQRQPHGKSVQNTIEAALSRILNDETLIYGSGRTDGGVHARGQCFHFDACWPHSPDKLVRALHADLPLSIQIRSARQVSADFHARHSALGKRYIYRYYLGRANPLQVRYLWPCRSVPLDFPAMREAASRLTGTHDFSAFGTGLGQGGDPNPVKTVHRLELRKHGNYITLTTEGSGYLYRMVRGFAGALYSVGRGRLDPDAISAILEARQRTHQIVTAPARGLCLDRVFY